MTRLPPSSLLLLSFFLPSSPSDHKGSCAHMLTRCLTQNKRTAFLSRERKLRLLDTEEYNFLDGNGPFSTDISSRRRLNFVAWRPSRGVCESKLARLFADTRLHVFECERVRSSTRGGRVNVSWQS